MQEKMPGARWHFRHGVMASSDFFARPAGQAMKKTAHPQACHCGFCSWSSSISACDSSIRMVAPQGRFLQNSTYPAATESLSMPWGKTLKKALASERIMHHNGALARSSPLLLGQARDLLRCCAAPLRQPAD